MYVCKGVFLLLVLYTLAHSLDSFPLNIATPLKGANPTLDSEWESWKILFKKTYKSLNEEAFRRAIWEKNWQLIETHNQEYEQGLHTYTLGMNQFGDMTPDEVC